jgi:nicotinamidase-related amidase
MRSHTRFFFAFILLLGSAAGLRALTFHARSQAAEPAENPQRFISNVETLDWAADETAIVVCDMWDQHWCRGATERVAEMAPHMNEVLKAARKQGVKIIHCPSSCIDFYKDTPMVQAPRQAPEVETDVPLRGWCSIDPDREPPLPIDDSDGGCDCEPPCETGSPWTRQIAALEIEPVDVITDNAQAYYWMRQQGIKNVIVMGVHTNMCVLGRPFSIRQLVYQGMNVVLMRDMTDAMYNSRMSPYVNHFDGVRLVVQHIERYWCPTILSTDLTGDPQFRFRADR